MATHANSTPAPGSLPRSITAALGPAMSILTGEYRALMAYDKAPKGSLEFEVCDDRFAPHLRTGEAAVVDTTDREPVSGEIYVVTIASMTAPGGFRLRFVQLRSKEYTFVVRGVDGSRMAEPGIGWTMHFNLIRPKPANLTASQIADLLQSGPTSISDGPLRPSGMRDKLVGRVVGVIL